MDRSIANHEPAPDRKDLLLLGTVAGFFFAAHAVVQGMDGKATNLFWACHSGAALIALGLLLQKPWVNACGTLILLVGLPLWAINLVAGGTFYPTSILTHVGGLSYGILGARQMGLPRRSWLAALACLLTLLIASLAFTPPGDNVNLVFKAWGPWARLFGSSTWGHLYLLVLLWALALRSAQTLLSLICEVTEPGTFRLHGNT